MAKFKYKYESIKHIKEVAEKKIQKDISFIEAKIKKREKKISEINEKKNIEKIVLNNKKNMLASELKFVLEYDNFLNEQIDKEVEKIEILINEKEKKIIELVEMSKEVKVFEKLKEKHAIEHYKHLNKIEQNEIDDIATKKFIKETTE